MSLAIINSTAPYSESNGKDALDIALIFGSYEQSVALFFQGDGVWQLVKHHNGELLGIKDYIKTLPALPFYDVEKLYVCQHSLKQRELDALIDIDELVVLSTNEFNQKLKSYQHILRF